MRQGASLGRAVRWTASLVLLPALGTGARAGVDVRVNQDGSLPIRQNETVVVVNPAFACPGGGLNVVAAYNDDPGDVMVTGTSGLGISWSCDGGATWTDAQTPIAPGYLATDPVADPSLAVDLFGTVYAGFFTSAGSPFTGQSAVLVTRSTDGGQTWSTPVAADTSNWPGGMNPPVDFLDKPWIAVDSVSSAPHSGNVYVTWQTDDPNGVDSRIRFARSTTLGASYSPSIQISDAPAGTPYQGNAPMPTVGGNGDVYVAWHDAPVNSHQPARLYVDRSMNGGLSFGPDTLVTTYRRPPQWPAAGQDFKVRGFPSIAADPRPGVPSVYVAYAADPDVGPETRLDTDAPGAAASVVPRLARSGTDAYAAWIDVRNGAPNADVYFNRSTDGGATWLASDVRINTNAAGTARIESLDLAASGSRVWVAWQDTRNGAADVFVNVSSDNGLTWLASDLRLDTDTAGAAASERIQLAHSGSHVYAAWEDQRGGGATEIRFNRSSNGGASWLANDVRISAGATDLGASPQIAAAGSDVYVVWRDAFVKFDRSPDNGSTWLSADVQLDAAVGPNNGIPARICADANGVFVVYEDLTRPNTFNPLVFSEQVHLNYSIDGGQTWLATDLVVDQGGAGLFYSGAPAIACSASHVYVAWEDGRLQGPAGYEPAFRAFDRTTASFGAERFLATTKTPGTSNAAGLDLAADGNAVHVVWRDHRFGPEAIHYQRSLDSGATWYGECVSYADQRLDVGSWPGTAFSSAPEVVAAGQDVLVAFQRESPSQQADVFVVRSTNGGASWQDGPDDGDVFLAASHDGAATWGTPVRVNDDATTHGQFQPRVDVKPNGTVDVAWLDRRNDPNDNDFEVFLAASIDGGRSFRPNAAVSDAPSVRATQRSPNCASPANNWEWMGEYIGIDVDATDAWIAWTDTRQPGTGSPDMDIRLDRVPNPGQRTVPLLHLSRLAASWSAAPDAVAYDVVRGDLSVLRSTGGDFMQSTAACLGDDLPFAWMADGTSPAAGAGWWILVRAVAGGGPQSYDSGGASQAGSRDSGIAAAPAACP